jgi:L-amino acid N-acyltransferase YncA
MIDRTPVLHRLTDDSFVREGIDSDIPAICQIWLQGVALAFGGSTPNLPTHEEMIDHFRSLLQRQDATFKFWVCVTTSDTLIGWSTVQPFHTTPLRAAREAYGFISTYMGDASRGRGVGSKLLEFVIAYCRNHTNLAYVLGIQDRSNIASVTISDRVGFVDYGVLPPSDRITPASIIVCPIG